MAQRPEVPGDWSFQFDINGMAAAGTAREDIVFKAQGAYSIIAVEWTPAAAVTANGTNFTTLSLRNRKADGTGTGLVASRSYAATNSAAFVSERMTLSGSNADTVIAVDDVLTVQMLVTGTGIQLPTGLIRVRLA